MCDFRMLDCCCPRNCCCSNGPRNGLQNCLSCSVEACDSILLPSSNIKSSSRCRRKSQSPSSKCQNLKEPSLYRKHSKKGSSRSSLNCSNMSPSKMTQPCAKTKKFVNKSCTATTNAIITACACPKPVECPCPKPVECPCPKPIECPCPKPVECPPKLTCQPCEELESEIDSHSCNSVPEGYIKTKRPSCSISVTKITPCKPENDMRLEDMKRAIEQALRAYFMHTMEKIECLSTQLLRNECMVAKLHLDVVQRISKLNERSFHQFQVLNDRVNKSPPLNSSSLRKEIEKSFCSCETNREECSTDVLDQKDIFSVNDFDNVNAQKTAAALMQKNSKLASCSCYNGQQDQLIAASVSVTSITNKTIEVEKFPTQHIQTKRGRRSFPIKAQPSLESVTEEMHDSEYIACELRVQELQQELECSKQELKRSMKRLQQFKYREGMSLESNDSKLSNIKMNDKMDCQMFGKIPSSSFESNKLSCSINIDCDAGKTDSKKPISTMCACTSQSKIATQQEIKQQRSNRPNSKQDQSNVQYVCCPNLSQRNRKQSKNRHR